MEAFRSAIAAAGPFLVGVVFLLSGLAKTLDLQLFVHHLARLDLFPHRTLVVAAALIVGFECVVGTGLMVGLWLEWLIPSTCVVLVGFAVVTYWGVASERVEDCGCYAGLVDVSPRMSCLLDVAYSMLLLNALAAGISTKQAGSARLFAVAAAGLVGVLLAVASHIRNVKTGAPLVATGPLRAGRRWRRTWLPEPWSNGVSRTPTIVVFLSPACTLCKKWVKALNLCHRVEGLPSVIGVVADVAPERLEHLRREVEARFPLVAIKPWSLKRLTRGNLPLAVVVRDETIREVWVRRIPPEFGDEIRRRLLVGLGARNGDVTAGHLSAHPRSAAQPSAGVP